MLQQRAMATINDLKVPLPTAASTGIPALEISQHSYDNHSIAVSQPQTQASLDSNFPFSPRPPSIDESNIHRNADNTLTHVEGRSGQWIYQLLQ